MLRVGTAKIDITPSPGLDLQGYAGRSQGASGVLDRLYARCIVIESRDAVPGEAVTNNPTVKRWALLSVDVISFETDDARSIRAAAIKILGTPHAQVTLSTTHTHSGPALLRLRNFGDIDPDYFQFITDAIADSVKTAAENLQAAFVLSSSGCADFAVNRRKPDEKGNIMLTPYPEGPVDHEVIVTAFYSPVRPEPLAIITNYACHPVTLGINDEYSADFPGVYARVVENAFPGAVALYLNGTSGDINPPAMDGRATTEACGMTLAGETINALSKVQHKAITYAQTLAMESERGDTVTDSTLIKTFKAPDSLAPLVWQEKTVMLPLRELPSRDILNTHLEDYKRQLESARRAMEDKGTSNTHDDSRSPAALVEWAKQCLAELDGATPFPNNEEAPVQTAALGTTAFVFLPGEIFVEYGLEIKRKSPFPHTHVVGYTNGWIGYIPTPDAIEKGGYEPTAYRYWQSRPFSPEAGSLLVKEALSQLKALAEQVGL